MTHEDVPPKKFKIPRAIMLVACAVTAPIASDDHIQKPILVYGGAITIVLVHLVITSGVVHSVPPLRKQFHGEAVDAL